MSLFGIARPPSSAITWTVAGSGTGGTGQAIISSIANLNDGRPDSTARFQWPTGGSQTLTTKFLLRGEWTSGAFAPRVIMISNISLPVGTKVSVAFRRSGDTVGTYPYVPTIYNNNQRVFAGPRGERTVVIVLPIGATADVVGVEIAFWNDVNGSISIAPATLFNLGEGVCCPGVDVDVSAGWPLKPNDPTMQDFTWNKQPYPEPGVPFRTWAFGFPVDSQLVFFGDPASPASIDYEELIAFLDRGQSVVYIPRYVSATGAFDAQILHRTAFIGVATQLPSWDHVSGTWFQTKNNALVTEAPIAT